MTATTTYTAISPLTGMVFTKTTKLAIGAVGFLVLPSGLEIAVHSKDEVACRKHVAREVAYYTKPRPSGHHAARGTIETAVVALPAR